MGMDGSLTVLSSFSSSLTESLVQQHTFGVI